MFGKKITIEAQKAMTVEETEHDVIMRKLKHEHYMREHYKEYDHNRDYFDQIEAQRVATEQANASRRDYEARKAAEKDAKCAKALAELMRADSANESEVHVYIDGRHIHMNDGGYVCPDCGGNMIALTQEVAAAVAEGMAPGTVPGVSHRLAKCDRCKRENFGVTTVYAPL